MLPRVSLGVNGVVSKVLFPKFNFTNLFPGSHFPSYHFNFSLIHWFPSIFTYFMDRNNWSIKNCTSIVDFSWDGLELMLRDKLSSPCRQIWDFLLLHIIGINDSKLISNIFQALNNEFHEIVVGLKILIILC